MSSSERTSQAGAINAASTKPAAQKAGSDQISTEKTAMVRAALDRQPEVRPEVVERGRQLAQDPNWPTPDVLHKVSELLVSSYDPTEETA